MPMRNKDLLKEENYKIVQKLSTAMQEGNAEAAAEAIQELHDSVAKGSSRNLNSTGTLPT